ncbi:testis-expressed protein 9 [Betta splendens]|uniref:Testis-expressed protein 9 n=1 Tax=Betta splendens TaxID=158456 RepID=A0A6P7LYC6_BETSP|nr:testis-expressed protein 9 [Betta splendens]
MSERSSDKKLQSVVSQQKKLLSCSTKNERSKKGQTRPQAKSAGPLRKLTDDLFAKEEEYKLLNAQLEAKTADLVRQAEQLMRDQNNVLSKSVSTLLLTDIDDEDNSRVVKPQQCTVQESGVKVANGKRVKSSSQNKCTRMQQKENKTTSQLSQADELGAEESANCFLARTIRNMEEKMNDTVTHENVEDDYDTGDNVGPAIIGAQTRVVKAKLRIMQEELDQLSSEYYKKDDENVKLIAKMKELEEDRARLQKNTNIQQTQIEKHRSLAEESAKKCDGLQLQVSGLQKEIENLNRSQKQAAAAHSTVEVRLNRALEEVEKLKTQLNKAKQTNKDKMNEEHQSKENLLAENKMLKKQKAELIVGFKKQLKLIDILKRQKMHFEAAKLLSFTEDEFMKALDWGNS